MSTVTVVSVCLSVCLSVSMSDQLSSIKSTLAAPTHVHFCVKVVRGSKTVQESLSLVSIPSWYKMRSSYY